MGPSSADEHLEHAVGASHRPRLAVVGEVAGDVGVQCDVGPVVPVGLDALGGQQPGIDLLLATAEFGPVLLARDRGVLVFEFSPIGARALYQAVEEPTRIDLNEVAEVDVDRPLRQLAIFDKQLAP